jgi:hypothetical protein
MISMALRGAVTALGIVSGASVPVAYDPLVGPQSKAADVHQSYADETCTRLHQIAPKTVQQRVAVTCRSPFRTTHFVCPAASGSRSMPVVEAEAIDDRCSQPWE